MRSSLLAALAIIAFAVTMTIETTGANEVVCVRGVVNDGCVPATEKGRFRVMSVRQIPACRYIVVNGMRVRDCR